MKVPTSTVAALLAVTLGLPPSAPAGEPAFGEARLIEGNRVRLYSTLYSRPLTGRVESIDEGDIVLAVDDAMVIRVPAGSLQRVRVSTARKRQTLRGALVGAAVGLPLGLTADVNRGYCGPGSSSFCSRGEAIAGMTLTTAGLGALVGRFVRADQWTDVRLPRVTIAPTDKAAKVTLAWRF